MLSPSSLSYTVITATFGRVGLLGLTGVGSGVRDSEVSVDIVLFDEGLSALALDLNKSLYSAKKQSHSNYWSCSRCYAFILNYYNLNVTKGFLEEGNRQFPPPVKTKQALLTLYGFLYYKSPVWIFF